MNTILKMTTTLTSNRLLNLWTALALGAATTVSGTVRAENPTDDPTQQSLVAVTSDAISGEVDISVETDAQGSLVALDYKTSTGVASRFTLDQLAQGIVLVHTQGMDVVKLTTDATFDSSKGGQITIDYLHDGMSGSRQQYETQLMPNTDTKWGLYTVVDPAQSDSSSATPELIPELFFKKKRNFLGMTVGIDHVEVRQTTVAGNGGN